MNENDILSQAVQVLSDKDEHDKALLQKILVLAQKFALLNATRLAVREHGVGVVCYPLPQGKIYALPCTMDKGVQIVLLFLEQEGEITHLQHQQIIRMPLDTSSH